MIFDIGDLRRGTFARISAPNARSVHCLRVGEPDRCQLSIGCRTRRPAPDVSGTWIFPIVPDPELARYTLVSPDFSGRQHRL